MFSHMAMSYVGTRLKDWGWSLDRVLQIGSLLLVLLTAAAVLDLWNNSILGWSLMVTATCITGVGYAKASLSFPVSMAGRASTTINFIVFVGAFAMQWGLGLIVDVVMIQGWSEADGLRIAFLFWVLCQGFALAWLVLLPKRPEPIH
jgi:hypothetical protein